MLKTSLRYFISVASHGSIRAASSELNVVQSAVSRQLQTLEHELGMPLLERRSRGVVLTEAGELVLAFARNAHLEVDRLKSELDELLGLERGHIRICAMETMVQFILPQAIMRFRSLHPRIAFTVTVATTDEVVEAVRSGQVDIGLGFSPVIGPEITLLYERLEPMLAVMTSNHPMASRQSVSIADIKDFPVALSPPRSGARVVTDQACREAGVKISPALESNSVDLLRRFAMSGDGIALLLRHTVSRSLDRGELTVLPFAEDTIAGTVTIMALDGRRLPLASEKMVTILTEELDRPSEEACRDAKTA